ncbi:MAG: metallophosphoesterase family protein [Myxococcales bacterium]|nr:serine/threonine protein phosphatase [Polyangiaceae bacterium]MDW8249015.1 metallophosphoesterase family protein [Myxococcales bacterium]
MGQSTNRIIDQEMDAIIYYLTAFAHIDGNYDQQEKWFIEQFIDKLVSYRTRLALRDESPEVREAQVARWTRYFQHVFASIELEIASHFTESVAEGENSHEFVFSRLKLRCYELFQRFSREDQQKLLQLADELMQADGQVHPNEAKFRAELEDLLAYGEEFELIEADEEEPATVRRMLVVREPISLAPRVENYDIFQAFERPFPRNRQAFAAQFEREQAMIERAISILQEQRTRGKGKLAGLQDVSELEGKGSFLDGYVYGHWPDPKHPHELLVLGDLHGCYSCLKAALLQADFFAKVDAHHLDPSKPAMKLVLLGDYIDRGLYSFDGVLRTVLQLLMLAPQHVYMLRGNHEFYVELSGRIFGGVKPSEAIDHLQGIADEEVFRVYKQLFEALPSTLLFGRALFTHAGIPRDDTLAARWRGLESLNDSEIRFQMLWSDPSEAEYIPLDLQKANARFPFGKRQFKSFLARTGCTLMIRGHERIPEGFRRVYQDQDASLYTLFSAGGATNCDLPPTSNYREVRPVALTIHAREGAFELCPFYIDWERYNRVDLNQFLRR